MPCQWSRWDQQVHTLPGTPSPLGPEADVTVVRQPLQLSMDGPYQSSKPASHCAPTRSCNVRGSFSATLTVGLLCPCAL